MGAPSPHRYSRVAAAVAAALLALGLCATPGLAARGGNTPVRGVVIGASSEEIEVQSTSGAVTIAITDETRVIRMVSGTVADLRRGQIVELISSARTGRVTQLHIAPAGTKLGEVPPSWGQGNGKGRLKNRMAQIRARQDSTFNGEDCHAASAYFLAMGTFPSATAFHAHVRNCLSFGKTGCGV